jgi:hypothetical protein
MAPTQDCLKVRGPELLPALRLYHLDPHTAITPVSADEEVAPRRVNQPCQERAVRDMAALAALGPFIDSLDNGVLLTVNLTTAAHTPCVLTAERACSLQ